MDTDYMERKYDKHLYAYMFDGELCFAEFTGIEAERFSERHGVILILQK